MRKIQSVDGTTHNLSEEVYEVIDNTDVHKEILSEGTLVRYIQLNPEKEVGENHHPDWCTVCRESREVAEFLGIRRDCLTQI